MRNNKVIVCLKGGLGNRMFQYAIARSTQIKFGLKHIELKNVNFFSHNRNGDIKNFLLPEIVTYRKHLVFSQRINNRCFSNKRRYNSYIDDSNRIIPIAHNKTNNYYFNGFFQSPQYFDEYKAIIKEDFQLKKPLDTRAVKLINEISTCESVCLHIRLGDYLIGPNKEKHYLCNKQYYYDAVDEIIMKIKQPIFYVFSDDLEKAKQLLNYYKDIKFIYINNAWEDYVVLYIMSKCNNFIISNSTFSWWAQYLCDNNNKIVCAPSKWLNNIEWSNIYQDNWTIIQIK